MPTAPCHSGLDPESSPPITIVCGSTATGKSNYAFNLAKQFKAVTIISVDSRQFYKHIPLISGQDNPSDIPGNVEFFGQGILEPSQVGNIGDFKKYVEPIIAAAKGKNKKIILVGGSGLYLKAITENLSNSKIAPDPEFRAKADTLSLVELQNLLKEINPSLFNSLNNSDVNNPRRLIRHLEISKHQFLKQNLVIPGPDPESSPRHCESYTQAVAIRYQWLGLRKSPENLLKTINERVIARLKNGAVEEVKELLKIYPDTSLPIYSTLGIKEIIKFLNKEITQEELIKLWTIADNNYAKRQIVWFKKQVGIVWYDNNI